jgi:hypothetical protein
MCALTDGSQVQVHLPEPDDFAVIVVVKSKPNLKRWFVKFS